MVTLFGGYQLTDTTELVLYTLHVWRGVFVAVDFQYIRHPGYNRDRGPVMVPGFRFHTDFQADLQCNTASKLCSISLSQSRYPCGAR